ncbi:MAG TPA: hypothetical protein VFF33_00575 [Ignavibacteriaceae bacterium]|nr:hypothetical protein [Ignavibacteriaceae bacterium]
MNLDILNEFDGSVTICGLDGTIIFMNEKAIVSFEKYGGKKLVGTNMFDCHPEDAQTKIKEIIDNKRTNAYTISKNGVKKLIFQSPWYEDGEIKGLVELSLELPEEMPHFERK